MSFTLTDAVKIKEARICLLQNMSTYKDKDKGSRGGQGGGGRGGSRTTRRTEESDLQVGAVNQAVFYCFGCGLDGHSKYNCPRKNEKFSCKHHTQHNNHNTLACSKERKKRGLPIYNPASSRSSSRE